MFLLNLPTDQYPYTDNDKLTRSLLLSLVSSSNSGKIQGVFTYHHVYVCLIYSILYINIHSAKLPVSKAAFPGPAMRHQNDHISKQHLLEFVGGIGWAPNAKNGARENLQ